MPSIYRALTVYLAFMELLLHTYIYGAPAVYLALSVGAGREEKVSIFRERKLA